MKQTILRNFIDDGDIDSAMYPIPTDVFEQQRDYNSRWLIMDTMVSDQVPMRMQQLKEYVPTKLEELQQISVNVAKITRAITKTPKPFLLFDNIPENTSYVLFISTQNITYDALPIVYNWTILEELPEDFIPLPITLNKGDAFLTQYTPDFNKNLLVHSSELRHLCVVYLEPKYLWP